MHLTTVLVYLLHTSASSQHPLKEDVIKTEDKDVKPGGSYYYSSSFSSGSQNQNNREKTSITEDIDLQNGPMAVGVSDTGSINSNNKKDSIISQHLLGAVVSNKNEGVAEGKGYGLISGDNVYGLQEIIGGSRNEYSSSNKGGRISDDGSRDVGGARIVIVEERRSASNGNEGNQEDSSYQFGGDKESWEESMVSDGNALDGNVGEKRYSGYVSGDKIDLEIRTNDESTKKSGLISHIGEGGQGQFRTNNDGALLNANRMEQNNQAHVSRSDGFRLNNVEGSPIIQQDKGYLRDMRLVNIESGRSGQSGTGQVVLSSDIDRRGYTVDIGNYAVGGESGRNYKSDDDTADSSRISRIDTTGVNGAQHGERGMFSGKRFKEGSHGTGSCRSLSGDEKTMMKDSDTKGGSRVNFGNTYAEGDAHNNFRRSGLGGLYYGGVEDLGDVKFIRKLSKGFSELIGQDYIKNSKENGNNDGMIRNIYRSYNKPGANLEMSRGFGEIEEGEILGESKQDGDIKGNTMFSGYMGNRGQGAGRRDYQETIFSSGNTEESANGYDTAGYNINTEQSKHEFGPNKFNENLQKITKSSKNSGFSTGDLSTKTNSGSFISSGGNDGLNFLTKKISLLPNPHYFKETFTSVVNPATIFNGKNRGENAMGGEKV